MKKINALIAFVLIHILLFTNITFAEEKAPLKTLDTKAFEIIKSFGFLNSEALSITENAPVTRAQMANIIAPLLGIDEIEYDDETFVDVPKDYWCADSIYALKANNIMQGVNKHQFKPEQNLTFYQAVKICVDILGYSEIVAKKYNSSQEGYFITANNLKLINNMTIQADEAILSNRLFDLLLKTCRTDVLAVVSVKNDMVHKQTDGTFLEIYHKIYEDEGIMISNGETSLSDEETAKNNYIIGSRKLYSEENSYEDLLGYYTEYFYKDVGDDGLLLYAERSKNKNRDIIINAEDLALDDYGFSMLNVVYCKEKKRENAVISVNSSFVYNGVLYNAFDINDYNIGEGRITLIDNNADGKYDVVNVEEFKNCFVLSVNESSEVVYGRYGDCIDFDKAKTYNIYDSDGNKIDIKQIKPNNILTYQISKDGNVINAYVSTERVTGKVVSVSMETTKRDSVYTIGDKNYLLAADLIDLAEEGKSDVKYPVLNRTYTFYLNISGKIAAVTQEPDSNYAYFVGVETNDFTKNIKMGFIMPNGDIFEAFLAKKITVNGTVCDKADILAAPQLYDEQGNIKKQLVEIFLNNLGYIKELNFAVDCDNPYGYDTQKFSLDLNAESALYKGSDQTCFDGLYSVSKSSVIYMIPSGNDFDIKDIKVVKPNSLVDGKNYSVSLYDCDATLVANAAVIKGTAAASFERGLLTVDKVIYTENKDGDLVKKVKGVMLSQPVEYFESEPNVFPEDLKNGDVCRIATDSTKNYEIEEMERFVSLKDHPEPFELVVEGTSVFNSDWANVFGYLYAKSPSAVSTIDPTDTAARKITAHSLNGMVAQVTVYDARTGSVRVGTQDDIIPNVVPNIDGSFDINDNSVMLFVYRRQDYAREIVVALY